MKKYKLPKDSLVEPEERIQEPFIDNDVEGHGLPTTAPPGIGQFPGHGGEAKPKDDEDDVEGHRRK